MVLRFSKPQLAINYFICVLVLVSSLLGLYDRSVYSRETENWAMQAKGQDMGNLIAVIVLVLSIRSITKGTVNAFLIWIGTLFYLIYAYLLYAFAVHFNYLFLAYVVILGLSFYSLIGGLVANTKRMNLSFEMIRPVSILLITIGTLFIVLWLAEIIPALMRNKIPESITEAGLLVNPVHVIDLSVVLPGMILNGIMLWRKQPLAMLLAASWLTFSVLMGCSIVITIVMDILKGNKGAMPPLIMVSLIVAVSMFALIKYLSGRIRSNEVSE